MALSQVTRQSFHRTVSLEPFAIYCGKSKVLFVPQYSNGGTFPLGLVGLSKRYFCHFQGYNFENDLFNADYRNFSHFKRFTRSVDKQPAFNFSNFKTGSRTSFALFSSSLKNAEKFEKAINEQSEKDKEKGTGDVDHGEKDAKKETKDSTLAKFKNIVNTFWLGCKQLMWIDARKAWATKKKLKRHDYDLTILTREELRHMTQTRKDMIKSLPVALLFFLPFIGYFAPIIGYLFPKKLLSQQFWDVEQRKKFAFEDHVKRSQYYLSLIQEVGWSSRELKNQELFQLCVKAIDGNDINNDDLIALKDLFHDKIMKVDQMPRFHLEKLCKTWLLPVKWYIPSKVLRELLAYRIKQIIEDDNAIRREGMDTLSDLCIRQACHARGLDKSSFDIPVMKNWLQDWMHLTKKVTDGDMSFVAHCAVFKAINFGKDLDKGTDINDSDNEQAIHNKT